MELVRPAACELQCQTCMKFTARFALIGTGQKKQLCEQCLPKAVSKDPRGVHQVTMLDIASYVERGGGVKELERRDLLVASIENKLTSTLTEIEAWKKKELDEIDVLEQRLMAEVKRDMQANREKVSAQSDDVINQLKHLGKEIHEVKYKVDLPQTTAGKLLADNIHVEQLSSLNFIQALPSGNLVVDSRLVFKPPVSSTDCCKIVSRKPTLYLTCGHTCHKTCTKINKNRCPGCGYLLSQSEFVQLFS